MSGPNREGIVCNNRWVAVGNVNECVEQNKRRVQQRSGGGDKANKRVERVGVYHARNRGIARKRITNTRGRTVIAT